MITVSKRWNIVKDTYKTFVELILISLLLWSLIIVAFTFGLRFLVFNFYLFISAITTLVFAATFVGYWSFSASYHLLKNWPGSTGLAISLVSAKFDLKKIIWLSIFSAVFTAIGFLLFL